MVVYLERADLLRSINTDEFFVKFRKVEYKLKAKNWKDAQKEGEGLLNKKFPNVQIILD